MMRRSWISCLACVIAVAAFFPALLPAQDRVTMSSPVIRTTSEGVGVTARFQGLNPERSYRIGIGVRGQLPEVDLELSRGDAPASARVADFIQAHTSNWWSVEQLSARGFQLEGNDIAGPSEEFLLRISIPRAEAEKLEQIYIFISRNYGGDIWYLEDGIELDRSYW